MKKYKVSKFTDNSIDKALLKLFAEVDPEALKKISNVLKRELSAEKDTEDYNPFVFSTFIDKAVLPLMNAGQSKLKHGDSLRLDEDIHNRLFKEKNDYFSDIERLKDYVNAPFTRMVAQELRNLFILKTNKSDNFESLMDEADGLITKYMSSSDWIKLRSLIKKSEARLQKSTYQMLEPDYFIGEEKQLTNTEVNKYSLEPTEKNATVDIRKDNHDLLTLKEFVSMLKGEPIHPLSIGPGFFAKYMPEIKEAGYHGVSLKVENDILKDVRLVSLKFEGLNYSPILSSQIIAQEYCSEIKESFLGKTRSFYDDKNSWDNKKYFVVVDGCIAVPSSMQLDYDKLVLNDTKLPSGEVFLFEKIDDEVLSTRLYFTPYDYSKLHLFHQHGSVIFGTNDQSLHSCISDDFEFFSGRTREYVIDKIQEGTDDSDDYIMFTPAFVSCLLNVLHSNDHIDVLDPNNFQLFLNCMTCLYETNILTIRYINEKYLGGMPKDAQELVKKLTAKYSPLTQRFLLGEYLEQKSGLTNKELGVTYKDLAEKMKEAWLVKLWHRFTDMGLKL